MQFSQYVIIRLIKKKINLIIYYLKCKTIACVEEECDLIEIKNDELELYNSISPHLAKGKKKKINF